MAEITPSLIRVLGWSADRCRDIGLLWPAAACRKASEACAEALAELVKLRAENAELKECLRRQPAPATEIKYMCESRKVSHPRAHSEMTCMTCEFKDRRLEAEPCVQCDLFNFWRPLVQETLASPQDKCEANKPYEPFVQRSCDLCLFEEVSTHDPPCSHCDYTLSLWQPKRPNKDK